MYLPKIENVSITIYWKNRKCTYPTKTWKCIQQKIGNVSTAIYWKMYRKCTDRKKEMYRPHLTKSVASSVFRSLSVFSISAESSAFQKEIKNHRLVNS